MQGARNRPYSQRMRIYLSIPMVLLTSCQTL